MLGRGKRFIIIPGLTSRKVIVQNKIKFDFKHEMIALEDFHPEL